MNGEPEKTFRYFLTMETPSGKCQIAAENWQVVVDLAEPYTYANMHFEGINSAARRAQMAYYKSYKRGRNAKGRSRMARDGMEIEVICCYMRAWGIEQTVKWLLEQKGYKTSLSAVGRYWKRLRAAGVLPVHKLPQAVIDEKDIIENPLNTAR